MNRLNIFRDIRFIITLGCIWVITLIASVWTEKAGNKEIGYGTAKNPTHKEKLFIIKEINRLEEKHLELYISYSYESMQMIEANKRKYLIWLVQTNKDYRKWNKLSLRKGNFLQSNPYNI